MILKAFWQHKIDIKRLFKGLKSGMLAPPRKKQASPRPVKLTKPVGRSGAKPTTDSNDGPFSSNYALEEERVGKYFHLTLCTDCDYLVHNNTFLK